MMFSIVKEYKQRKRYNISQLLIKDKPVSISELLNKKEQKEENGTKEKEEMPEKEVQKQVEQQEEDAGFDNEKIDE